MNSWQLFAIFSVLISVLHGCGTRTSTQEFLDASFLPVDGAAIELQSPIDNTSVSTTPTFVWSARPGVTKYRLEVSATNDFSQSVLDKILVRSTNYTLVNSDLIGITGLDTVGYYWRVSAFPRNQLQSRVFTMQVVGVTPTLQYRLMFW